ncbi:MAG: CpsD/CapB family tyrosine-protein kinase [Pseudomonadota bacterium]
MDRIREAISRARVENDLRAPAPAAGNAAVAPKPAPMATQPGSLDALATIRCDYDVFHKNRIISNEQDPVLNAYRVLRTRVLQRMEANNWRTIAVISPGASAGKTVTAINLSITLASKAGIRPTLVDIDFYRPSVARYLGLEHYPSVLDFYEGKKALEDVTVRPDLPDMLLMPNERVTRRGAEVLASNHTDELVRTVTERYGSQIVVFDMPPLLGCDDALAFLPKIDCVLLVAASGQTRVAELKEAKRILAKSSVIGTVLNKSPRMMMPNQYY